MQEPFYSYSSVSYKKEQPFPPLHACSEKGNHVRHVNIKLYNRCCFCDALFIGNFIRLPTEIAKNGTIQNLLRLRPRPCWGGLRAPPDPPAVYDSLRSSAGALRMPYHICPT